MVVSARLTCSNCGSPKAERVPSEASVRTTCEYCDYLLATCTRAGRVIEAYAPGLKASHVRLVHRSFVSLAS